MSDQPLSQYISLNRRYSRSVNLERDLAEGLRILRQAQEHLRLQF